MNREFAFPGTRPRWAPDRVVDIQHLALELTVDPAKRGIAGTATLRVAVIAPDTRSVELDAVELTIERVTVGGAAGLGGLPADLSGAGFSNCVAWPKVLTMSQLAPVSRADPLHFKHYFQGLTSRTVIRPH